MSSLASPATNCAKLQIDPQQFSLLIMGRRTLSLSIGAEGSAGARTPEYGELGLSEGRDRIAIRVTNTTSPASISDTKNDPSSLAVVSRSPSSPTGGCRPRSAGAVAFRFLTTDKRMFTVTPREGILEIGETQIVVIAFNRNRDRELEQQEEVACPKTAKSGETNHEIDQPVQWSVNSNFKVEYRGLCCAIGRGDYARVANARDAEVLASTSSTSNSHSQSLSISDIIRLDKSQKHCVLLECVVNHCRYLKESQERVSCESTYLSTAAMPSADISSKDPTPSQISAEVNTTVGSEISSSSRHDVDISFKKTTADKSAHPRPEKIMTQTQRGSKEDVKRVNTSSWLASVAAVAASVVAIGCAVALFRKTKK